MDFDPTFPEKIPYLSGFFPEIKSEIPTSGKNITFCMYQNNFNHFQQQQQQQQSMNETNHDNHLSSNVFSKGSSSSFMAPLFTLSTTPSSGDSSSSYKPHKPSYPNDQSLKEATFANPSYLTMPFAPNSDKVDPMHGHHTTTNKAIWDFSHPQVMQKKGNGKNYLKMMANIIKGQWSAEEDRVLIQLVKRFGIKKWSHVARLLNGRVGKQCRERWYNHLRPNIRKDSWSEEEDKTLIEAHKEVGNKWAEIARRMPGRTENTIKNHWNATKRRLNAKKMRSKRRGSKKGATVLENYIREVTEVEEAEKELKDSMNNMTLNGESTSSHQGHYRVWYESSEGEFNEEEAGWNNVQPYGGGYVPMMVNTVENSTMDYGLAMEMGPEMNKEMDLMMDFIYRKP